jgi:DNA-binding transcriptional MerR regulator
VSQLPEQTYSIGQAARQLGLNPKTLRRWEKAQKHLPQRTLGGQRRYTDKDILVLKAIKNGRLTKAPPPSQPLLSPQQAAKTAGVSLATLQRWTRQKRVKPFLDKLGQKLFHPQDIVSPKLPSPPPPAAPQPVTQPRPSWAIAETIPFPWFKLAAITSLVFSFGLGLYLLINPQSQPKSPAVEQLDITSPQVEVAMPQVGSFLDGRITIGSDTGDLSFLDQNGNLYLSQAALVNGGVTTPALTLTPSDPPTPRIGRQYLDKTSSTLKYFNGTEWVSVNQTTSTPSQLPSEITGTSFTAKGENISLTLGDADEASSSTSLNLTLAGSQSRFNILGEADQTLISFNDDTSYPVSISQPTLISANLHTQKLLDSDNASFYLDPSSSDLSLNLAGEATISATLKFSKNGEYLTNSVDNYLIASGGLTVGGSTKYGFDFEGDLKARDTEVSSLTVKGDLIAKNNIYLGNDDDTIILSGSNVTIKANSSGNDVTLRAADQIIFHAGGDTSDYLYLATSSDAAGLFFSGYGSTDPGIRVNPSTNEIEYRDESESDWTSFDSGMATGWTDGGTDVYLTDSTDWVGIGTTNPASRLEVVGDIQTTSGSFIADGIPLDVPDYVFENGYQLLSPISLQEFIATYHHLPGVPSEESIKTQGLNLGQFSLTLLAKLEETTLYILDLYQQVQHLQKIITPLASNTLLSQIIESDMIKPLDNQTLLLQVSQVKSDSIQTKKLTAETVVTQELVAEKVKANTIEGLKEKIASLVDKYREETATASAEPLIQDYADQLDQLALSDSPVSSTSANLSLDSVEASFAFFSDYLAVMGQTTTTDLKVNQSLLIGDSLVLAANSISALDQTLYIQPSATGSVNLMAGLMTLDDQGNVIISGNLSVTGQVQTPIVIASEISPPLETDLAIRIASHSAISIYNPITGPVASIDASGSASFSQLRLRASGQALIQAGENHALVSTEALNPTSQVIITFTSDYKPADKYWIIKEPEQKQFTVLTNYPVNNDTSIDWLIVN